ncbi:MAG: methyltransferase domain-containing protein [Nanoarchaeota archaeon]
MKLFIHLCGDNLELAAAEACEALQLKQVTRDGHYLLGASSRDDAMLGYSHAIYELLFSCPKKSLMKKARSFAWRKHFRGSLCVRSAHDEQQLADIIHSSLGKPSVNLKKPGTLFRFFFGKKAYACRLIKEMPPCLPSTTTWPRFHPSSTNPRLARALVNLSGLQKGRILDPFCGIGTIPIEAGLHGLTAEGIDFSKKAVASAKRNAKHFHSSATFQQGDGLKPRKADAIVSDLPFGKNSAFFGKRGNALYDEFLGSTKARRVVVVLPCFNGRMPKVRMKGKTRYRIVERAHASLWRLIVVLDP